MRWPILAVLADLVFWILVIYATGRLAVRALVRGWPWMRDVLWP